MRAEPRRPTAWYAQRFPSPSRSCTVQVRNPRVVRARAHRTADASRSNGGAINTRPGQAAWPPSEMVTKPATAAQILMRTLCPARKKLISQGEDTSRVGVSSLDTSIKRPTIEGLVVKPIGKQSAGNRPLVDHLDCLAKRI